jgi:hypothetical protein
MGNNTPGKLNPISWEKKTEDFGYLLIVLNNEHQRLQQIIVAKVWLSKRGTPLSWRAYWMMRENEGVMTRSAMLNAIDSYGAPWPRNLGMRLFPELAGRDIRYRTG